MQFFANKFTMYISFSSWYAWQMTLVMLEAVSVRIGDATSVIKVVRSLMTSVTSVGQLAASAYNFGGVGTAFSARTKVLWPALTVYIT